jgi:NAD(P)H-dependent flavin oxidoreductase YrpB (nitropropane dioxygenase family)
MPLQGMLVSELMQPLRKAKMWDWSFHPAGQITGMVNEIKPAAQIVEEMVEQAIDILDRLPAEVAPV